MNSPGCQVPDMLLEISGEITPETTETGYWSMNQGKLEVVKQEMAKGDIDILGINELKWTGMGNLTQMTIISTTVGKNPLEEMEQPSQSAKESEMQYLGAISKMTE